MKAEETQEDIQDEIERKFIMRELPNMKFDDIIFIEQYYVQFKGKPYRVRFSYDLNKWNHKGDLRTIEFIWKEKISKGHNKEHHKDITEEEARKLIFTATKYVEKIRHVVKADFKYEIDLMMDVHLVMMEVEVPILEIDLNIPTLIKENILFEVTGNPKFDNYNLAKNL